MAAVTIIDRMASWSPHDTRKMINRRFFRSVVRKVACSSSQFVGNIPGKTVNRRSRRHHALYRQTDSHTSFSARRRHGHCFPRHCSLARRKGSVEKSRDRSPLLVKYIQTCVLFLVWIRHGKSLRQGRLSLDLQRGRGGLILSLFFMFCLGKVKSPAMEGAIEIMI